MSRDEDEGEGHEVIPTPAYDITERIEQYRHTPVEELLKKAHKTAVIDLLAKVEAGVASHQELAVLARLLADSGLVFTGPGQTIEHQPQQGGGGEQAPPPNRVAETIPALPVFDDDDDTE